MASFDPTWRHLGFIDASLGLGIRAAPPDKTEAINWSLDDHYLWGDGGSLGWNELNILITHKNVRYCVR